MEAAVKRFEPYWREMQLRAGLTGVPASTAPVRLPCGCHGGFAHTRASFRAEWGSPG